MAGKLRVAIEVDGTRWQILSASERPNGDLVISPTIGRYTTGLVEQRASLDIDAAHEMQNVSYSVHMSPGAEDGGKLVKLKFDRKDDKEQALFLYSSFIANRRFLPLYAHTIRRQIGAEGDKPARGENVLAVARCFQQAQAVHVVVGVAPPGDAATLLAPSTRFRVSSRQFRNFMLVVASGYSAYPSAPAGWISPKATAYRNVPGLDSDELPPPEPGLDPAAATAEVECLLDLHHRRQGVALIAQLGQAERLGAMPAAHVAQVRAGLTGALELGVTGYPAMVGLVPDRRTSA